MYKRITTTLLIVFLALSISSLAFFQSAQASPERIWRFSAEKSDWEKTYESQLKEIPDPAICEEHSFTLSYHPHMAGTSWDYEDASYIYEKYLEYGLEAEIVEYQVYLPYPIDVKVKLLEPYEYECKVMEDGWPWHADTYDEAVIGFNAYSPPGDITTDLIYVNYGVPEDYTTLKEMGIDVTGNVVIARYGVVFRGVKAKVAYEHGAAGLIIFSDPSDDGYVQGKVYPDGPWRPEDSIQRGSIVYFFLYPGDPLTPGWASVEGTHYLEPEKADVLPKIPTTPLAYREATPLLKALGGPEVPKGWQGGLPFTYHIGPGPAKVRLKVEVDYQIRTIWNVIGYVRGTKEPDKLVVLGCHHDAWVHGTLDPLSGSVAMLEMARSLGILAQEGYRPERTIALANWDAEEFGIIGSTEWGEEFKHYLRKNGVAYINLDGAVSGPIFGASAVPALDRIVRDVTKEIEDPYTGERIYDIWYKRNKARLGRLGGGSDWAVFLQHIGIPSVSLSYSAPYGYPYHSMYDDFYWMKYLSGDTEYKYHATMAKTAGILALRLANADVLPFDYTAYADETYTYLESVQKMQTDLYGKVIVDFSRHMKEAKEWSMATKELDTEIENLLDTYPIVPKNIARYFKFVNEKLLGEERALTHQHGLPGRAWYKHLIYAPGLYTGYAVETLPGLRTYITSGEWPTVKNQAAMLFDCLVEATNLIKTASVVSAGYSYTVTSKTAVAILTQDRSHPK